MKNEPQEVSVDEDKEAKVDWTDENDLKFALAMVGHKAVGIERNLHMTIIHDKFIKSYKGSVDCEQLWAKLRSYYDLDFLEEHQPGPWDDMKDVDFSLPSDFLTDKSCKASSVESKRATSSTTTTSSTTPSTPAPTPQVTPKPANKKRLRASTSVTSSPAPQRRRKL